MYINFGWELGRKPHLLIVLIVLLVLKPLNVTIQGQIKPSPGKNSKILYQKCEYTFVFLPFF